MNMCLYCLRQGVSFSSEEHTIPRGLGNETIVLDKGIVCDDCNNGMLSTLDSTLLNFEPIKYMRAFYGIKSRRGQYTNYKESSFHMAHTTSDHIQLTQLHDNRSVDLREDGFTLKMKSAQKLTDDKLKLLARAFYKMALGIVYLDLGRAIAYSHRFDEVREIILGKKDFNGYLVFGRYSDIEQIARIQHYDQIMDGRRISFFRFYYYGIEVFYDMEHRAIELPPEFPADKVSILRF